MYVVHGTLSSTEPLPAIELLLTTSGIQLESRQSAHYTGGQYLRLLGAEIHMTLERASETEYLCRADSESLELLSTQCSIFNVALTSLGIPHRLEIYSDTDELLLIFQEQI